MKTKNVVLIATLILFIGNCFGQLSYQTAGYYYYDASFNELEQKSNSIEAIIDAGQLTGFCIVTSGLGINASGAVVEGTHVLKTDINGSVVTNGDLFIPGLLDCGGFKMPLKVKNDYAYVAGRFTNMASYYFAIVKIYLPTMSIMWEKTEDIVYHGNERPIALDVIGGSVYITGTVNNDAVSYDAYDTDANAFLMKINANTGAVFWVNEIDGNITPQAIQANQVESGHEIIVTGNIYTEDFSDVTMFVYKANHLGVQSFNYNYDIKGIFEEAFSIVKLSNGNYLIVGTTIFGCSNGPDNVLAMEINNSGDVVKSKVYGSLDESQPNWIGIAGALTTSSDGAVYICGFELGEGGTYNGLILGIDNELECTWAITTGLSVNSEKYLDIVTVCADAPNYDCSIASAPAIVAIGIGDNDTYNGQTYVSTVSNTGITDDDCDQEEQFYTNTVVVKRYQAESTYELIRQPYQNTFTTKLSTPLADYICFDYYAKQGQFYQAKEFLIENEKALITVYPNPTNENIIIDINDYLIQQPFKIYIYNMDGHIMFVKEINEILDDGMMNISCNYTSGSYLLVIESFDGKRIAETFVIQNY